MKISEVLDSKEPTVVTVGPDDTVAAAARCISDAGKGLAVVLGPDDALLGVVSVVDITRAVAERVEHAPSMPVRAIMSSEVSVCGPDDRIEDALGKMTAAGIRHLPVIQNGALRGLVNLRDLLSLRAEQADMTVEEMRGYMFGAGYH